jgi:hypothetical protein
MVPDSTGVVPHAGPEDVRNCRMVRAPGDVRVLPRHRANLASPAGAVSTARPVMPAGRAGLSALICRWAFLPRSQPVCLRLAQIRNSWVMTYAQCFFGCDVHVLVGILPPITVSEHGGSRWARHERSRLRTEGVKTVLTTACSVRRTFDWSLDAANRP